MRSAYTHTRAPAANGRPANSARIYRFHHEQSSRVGIARSHYVIKIVSRFHFSSYSLNAFARTTSYHHIVGAIPAARAVI